jgi:hypothetical protein
MTAQYTDGTVTFTQGSATVTGDGTQWQAVGISVGDVFVLQGGVNLYRVGNVVSNTELTLSAPFGEPSAAGASYGITRDFTPAGNPLMGPGTVGAAPTFNESVLGLESLFFEQSGIAGSVAAIFATTSAGISATSDGEYFFVASTGGTILTLYLNDDGTAEEINDYPTAQFIKAQNQAAQSAANRAEDARDDAEDARDDLLSRYYGALSGEPSTRPDGSASQSGDLYYNTSSDSFFVYDGDDWLLMTIPTGDTGTASAANIGTADAELPTNKIIRDRFGLYPAPAVKWTLASDFVNDKYEIYDGIDEGFVKKPLVDIWDVTRASEETAIDPTGLVRTASAGILAGAFDPETGEPRGKQVFGARTNLLLRSGELTESPWVDLRVTVASSSDFTPVDGSLFKITENTETGSHSVRQSVSGLTSGQPLTLFAICKKAERTQVLLRVDGAATPDARGSFNLNDGTVSTTQNTTGSGVVPFSDDFYLVYISLTANADGETFPEIALQTTPGTAFGYTGDGTSGLFVSVAQLTATSFPVPYIPTTDSQVTVPRTDVAKPTGDWFNPDEGTFFVEFEGPAVTGSTQVIAGFNGGVAARRWVVQISNDGRLSMRHIEDSDGVQDRDITLISAGNYAAGATYRVATKINGSQVRGSVNGASVVSSAIKENAPITQVAIGRRDGASDPVSGTYVKQLRYAPRALPDDILIALTTPRETS